jgi:hypothetical protein
MGHATWSYDMVQGRGPPPHPSPLPSVSWAGDKQEDRERGTTYGRGVVGGGAKSRIIRPPESLGASINHSILSDLSFVKQDEF